MIQHIDNGTPWILKPNKKTQQIQKLYISRKLSRIKTKRLRAYKVHENNDPEWPTSRHILIKLPDL